MGWSHKRGAAVVAAGGQQSRVDICPVLAPEEVEVSFEDRPQADTGPQPAIIEHEGRARSPVCANDALVAVNREQHAYSAALRSAAATIHSRRNCSRKNRSSMARADLTVRAPVSACAPSESSVSMADTSQTAISLPSAPNTGAPEQLKSMCRDLKCWLLWTVTGRSSTMQVPMPFVPSTSSDHTPPSQVPQYSNWLACASSPRCSTATPELSQNKTEYRASRTTLYN